MLIRRRSPEGAGPNLGFRMGADHEVDPDRRGAQDRVEGDHRMQLDDRADQRLLSGALAARPEGYDANRLIL
jgi:hypothetical protein